MASMNTRVRDSSGEYEYRIFDAPLAASISGADPKELEPSFEFAQLSKAKQRQYIDENLRKKQEQGQAQEQEQTGSFNYPYTLMNYATQGWQKLMRRQKSDSQVEGKIGSANIIVSDDPSTEENSEKIVLSKTEFKSCRKLYQALVNLVNFKDCSATRASVTRGWHTINPNTIVTVDGKETFNANRIDVIKYEDYEISLVASMGVNPKKKQAVSFFKWVKRETDRKADGTPGRQVVLVNLTEDHEKLSYMPQNEQDAVILGGSAKSYSCFSRGDSYLNRGDAYLDKPYSLERMPINNEIEKEMAPVEEGKASDDRFCKIQIRNGKADPIRHKAITSVSFKVKDHYPIKQLKDRVEKVKNLIKADPSTKEKTLVVNCQAGMGRTSQLIIAMMIDAEIEQGTGKTVEELLIHNVWKFCAARRFFAVNEAGFMTLYCYARERLKEREANCSETEKPLNADEAFIAKLFDEMLFNVSHDEEILNGPIFGKDAHFLTDEEVKKRLRPVVRFKLDKLKQWFVRPRRFKFNRKKETSSTAPPVMDHAVGPETVSLANEPKKWSARLAKLRRSRKRKTSSTTPPLTSQVVSPETASLADESKKWSARLAKLRRSRKKETSSTTPSVMNQVVSPATAPPASNLNDDTISSAASTKSHSSNAEESQKGQPSKLSEKSKVSALRKKFMPKSGPKGSKAPEPPKPTNNWRLTNGV